MDLDGTEMRDVLLAACQGAGSQKAWAAKHGLSQAYVSDVLAERREPGAAICLALGYERIEIYRKTVKDIALKMGISQTTLRNYGIRKRKR